MEKVFLSYSRKDIKTMNIVRDHLRSGGLTVWTDENLIPGTPSWKNGIQQALEDVECLVVILSPDAKNSRWVQEEMNYADTHQKRIFPIMVRGDERTSVPFGFITAQWIESTRDLSPEVAIGLWCEGQEEPYTQCGFTKTKLKEITPPAWREAIQEYELDACMLRKLLRDRILIPI